MAQEVAVNWSPEGESEPDFWPVWNPAGNLRGVAAYVSEHGVHHDDRLRLPGSVLKRYDGVAGGEARRTIVHEQYQRLRDQHVPYDHEPLLTTTGQMVRHGQWVLEESGTCLDLSVLLAAMCLTGGVAPYVALAVTGRSAHALLVFDVDRDLDLGHNATRALAGPRSFEPDVVDVTHDDRPQLLRLIETGELLPVDAMRAAEGNNGFDLERMAVLLAEPNYAFGRGRALRLVATSVGIGGVPARQHTAAEHLRRCLDRESFSHPRGGRP